MLGDLISSTKYRRRREGRARTINSRAGITVQIVSRAWSSKSFRSLKLLQINDAQSLSRKQKFL